VQQIHFRTAHWATRNNSVGGLRKRLMSAATEKRLCSCVRACPVIGCSGIRVFCDVTTSIECRWLHTKHGCYSCEPHVRYPPSVCCHTCALCSCCTCQSGLILQKKTFMISTMKCLVHLLRNIVTARFYVMFLLSIALVYLEFKIKIGLKSVLEFSLPSAYFFTFLYILSLYSR
jgi:hypothetical protein